MWCHLYVRDGLAYIPTAARTEAGFHVDIEPVDVVPVADLCELAQAIKRALVRGHPQIPTPTRASGLPKPIVLKYAKMKSWPSFERTASYWQFSKFDETFQIEQWQPGPEGGWVSDPAHTKHMPPGTSLDDAVNKVTRMIQLGWSAVH
jgi:hypothetical protein